MQDKIKLEFHSVGEIVGNKEVGVITLIDATHSRCIAIVCDDLIKKQIHMRLTKQKLCNTMIPEVLSNILMNQAGFHFEIIINDIVDGVYRAMLVNTDTYQPISMRASDAVLLHAATKIPIYATMQLMQRQSVPLQMGAGIALPYNALSDDMLRDAMKAAVETERYEVASTIRDELKRRGVL